MLSFLGLIMSKSSDLIKLAEDQGEFDRLFHADDKNIVDTYNDMDFPITPNIAKKIGTSVAVLKTYTHPLSHDAIENEVDDEGVKDKLAEVIKEPKYGGFDARGLYYGLRKESLSINGDTFHVISESADGGYNQVWFTKSDAQKIYQSAGGVL